MTMSMANPNAKHQPISRDAVAAVNQVVADSMRRWGLSDRLYRVSLPAYQYSPADWIDHHFFGIENQTLDAVIVLSILDQTSKASEPSERITLIHGLYVKSAYQGQGYGRALIDAAHNWARTQTTGGLLVRAHARAVSYFEELGFSQLPICDPERDYPHRMWRPL